MAIGGDGEVLWNSISKYVSVVGTSGGASKSVSEDDPPNVSLRA